MSILAAFALATVAFVAGVDAGVPGSNTFYQIQPAQALAASHPLFPRSTCLTVIKAEGGQHVVNKDCTAGTQQRGWNVVLGGATNSKTPAPYGPITIFNTFCLEVENGRTDSGAMVLINPCVANKDGQQWQWNWDGTIRLKNTKKCLDLTEGDRTNGNHMQIWTCLAGNQNQIFTANTLANPLNQIALASKPSFCISATSTRDGAPVSVASCKDSSARKVFYVPQVGHGNSGVFKLASSSDGKGPFCLDVTDGKKTRGTKIQLWTCNENNPNQQFIPTGTIRWLGTDFVHGMCIDLPEGRTDKGNQLQIWDCVGNANQIWNDVEPAQNAL